MDRNEAAAALAGLSGAQDRLAAQIGTGPLWRHAAFGLVMTLLVGGMALPMPLQSATTVMAMAMVVIIVQDDRRRYGVFINGYRRGRTLPLTFGLLAGVLLLILAELWAREAGWPLLAKIGIAVAAFAWATGGSVVWQRLYLRELKARGQ